MDDFDLEQEELNDLDYHSNILKGCVKVSNYNSWVSPYEEIYEHVGNLNDLIFHSLSGITNPDIEYQIKRSNADCFSIEYVLDGEGYVHEDENMYTVKKGDFFILHPWKKHFYYSSKKNPWKKIWIYVPNAGYYISSLLNIYHIENQVIFPCINSPLNLNSIFELHKTPISDFSSTLELSIHELIMKLAYKNKKNFSVNAPTQKAKWYINQNIDKKITVNDVADYVGLNPAYLSQVFKKDYNINPVQYILKKKIAMAKHLLASSTLSVSDIAYHLNFTDTTHFSRTFKKYSGCTPLAYKSQALKNTKNQQ